MPYRIESKFGSVEPHQESIKALWETLWKYPCKIGVFPFLPERNFDDFEKVFHKLIEDDVKAPYDYNIYASAFFPVAENLVQEAQAAEAASDKTKASALYLRASALYRIARFPIIRTPKQWEAWARNQDTFFKGAGLLDPPMTDVRVAHNHRTSGEGPSLQVAMRVPASASAANPVPLIIRIGGLDGYRTEMLQGTTECLARGWGCVCVEVPGTGDCPASKQDPTSPDRLWSSLLDWLDGQTQFHRNKRCVWGLSTGGYYATRIAVTHKDRLAGSIAQGGGCHGMFDPVWLDGSNLLEYPFPLAPALAEKFGYDSVEAFKKDAQKRYSLLENGMLDMPCAPQLIANGIDDEIFPIEDLYIALEHGPAKSARVAHSLHMGEPEVHQPILEWIEQLFDRK